MMDFLPEHEFGHLPGVVGRPGLDYRQQQVFGFLMQYTITDRHRAVGRGVGSRHVQHIGAGGE